MILVSGVLKTREKLMSIRGDLLEIVKMGSSMIVDDVKRMSENVKKILNFDEMRIINRNSNQHENQDRIKMDMEHEESRMRALSKLSEMDIGYHVDRDGVSILEEKSKISYTRNRYGFPKDLNKYKKSRD